MNENSTMLITLPITKVPSVYDFSHDGRLPCTVLEPTSLQPAVAMLRPTGFNKLFP